MSEALLFLLAVLVLVAFMVYHLTAEDDPLDKSSFRDYVEPYDGRIGHIDETAPARDEDRLRLLREDPEEYFRRYR